MASVIHIEYEFLANRFLWPIDEILTGTISADLSVSQINGNEKTLHNSKISSTRGSPLDTV